jgi:hypothetical protein
LEVARLANHRLMEAIYGLAWLKGPAGLVSVNWRDMETEEWGSVYEGLLELTSRLTADGRGFAFAEASEAKGNARKTARLSPGTRTGARGCAPSWMPGTRTPTG